MNSCYFDYNSTTPVLSSVLEAMEPFWSRQFANPSSPHHLARGPYKEIREARRQVAQLIGAQEDQEIIFTSGGSEANNTAIWGALRLLPERKEIITTTVEHSSVLKLMQWLENEEGYQIHYIPVLKSGAIDLAKFKSVITENTALVSIMMANNETGVLFPIRELSEIAKTHGAYMHVDAVQAVGKVPVLVEDLGADFLTLSAHKFYGPKGVGALYCHRRIKIEPLLMGGTQERGRRAGTENVPGIIGFGAACEVARKNLTGEYARLSAVRDEFEKSVEQSISGITFHGKDQPRLPNTVNLRFAGINAETLLMKLDQQGICVARGSACMSGAGEPSHVLKAMGLTDDEANSVLRISFGLMTDEDEIEKLLKTLIACVDEMRSFETFEKQKKQLVN